MELKQVAPAGSRWGVVSWNTICRRVEESLSLNPFSRGPGRRKSLNGLVVAVLALFASAPSRAFDLQVEDTRPGIRLSAGIDVY